MDSVEEAIEYIKPFATPNGTCDDEEALTAVNDARELLWDHTNYQNITEYICVKCTGDCFYLPSAYKKFNLAWYGNETVSMGDEWYQALPYVGLDQNCSCHRKIIDVGGYHVTFDNYHERPYYMAVQAENNVDVGVEITLFGIDPNGTRRKEVLTTKTSPTKTQSKRQYVAIEAAMKPKTQGRIRVYAIDPVNGNYKLLAIYQPYDVNPSFRKLKLNGCKCPTMTLWVKKKYRKLEATHELVEFPRNALTIAAMANTYLKAKNTAEYVAHRDLAVQELEHDMADMEINATSILRQINPNIVCNLL